MFKALLKNKIDEQQKIVDAALTEKRGMSAEEQTKFEDLQKEIDGLEKTIAAQDAVAAKQATLTTPVNGPAYTKPAIVDKPFANLGEQMMAVIKAGQPGGEIDPRLLKINAAATGASEGVPADGGFLVQTDFSSELLRDVYETGILAPKCRKIGISANANSIKINGINESSRADGSRWGGVQGYWAAEAAQVTGTKPKFGQINLNLHKLMALYYATDELLQDVSAMDSILSQAFAEEIKFKLDDSIIRGDGAGKPLGILSAGCLVTVAKEAAQPADSVVAENVMKMWSRMIASSRANAVWLINQEIEPELFTMGIAVGAAGIPVYMPANGVSGQPYGTLFGRPVLPIEHCSALGDVGDIILADFSQYLLADKGAMQTASSIHVQFLTDETAFRVTYRVDGQPARASVITPFKGTNTLSSFVTLAAR